MEVLNTSWILFYSWENYEGGGGGIKKTHNDYTTENKSVWVQMFHLMYQNQINLLYKQGYHNRWDYLKLKI